ncbi:hypothetical protein [Actinomadura sp. HBU206391]|uniref:hypothetical protein n=1 Tax=Actinomadura sp. HBU206391 TaxID=2731692 RepID=UPI00164F1B92|nr:hypothetical protein [Actinomadura sp. HBU206391]MBC6457828.1 hypothetical protein [Actinomadura sp. HBU206391]
MTDVEERLRAALHAKANTIEPSREAWEKAIAGRRRWRGLPFLAVPLLAAMTVAAVIAVSMVVAPEPPRRPAATPSATPGPRLDQYYFVKERSFSETNGEKENKTVYRWVPIRPGPMYDAFPDGDGKFRLMQQPTRHIDPEYDVRTFPSDPTQMLARARSLAAKAINSGRTNGEPRDDQAVGILESVAANPLTSPERVLAVFQAMTMVPGERIIRNVKDPLGRPSIRLSKRNSLGGSYHEYFSHDARTYHGAGGTYVDGPNNSWNVRHWRVITNVSVVDEPGQFPHGEKAPALVTFPARVSRG